MEVDAKMQADIAGDVAPLMGGMAGGIVLAAAAGILMLVGTNIKSRSLAGDKSIHPTEDDVSVSKSDIAASEKEGALSEDSLAAQNGELNAARTDAAAQDGELKALDTGASAARTKAGAADIATKGLNMT